MVVWFGLEDELIQQPHDLIRTKRNNTEHQMRLDFLVSTHPQVVRSKIVLETAIHPFNYSSLSIALICRMDKTGTVDRLAFSCLRLIARRYRRFRDTQVPASQAGQGSYGRFRYHSVLHRYVDS